MSENGDPIGAKSLSIEKLTKADLPGTVFHLAWPVVLETTLFGLGGIINTILVGRLGAPALAAVGLGQQIEFMLEVAFAAVAVGATAVVSRHIGAKEIKEANQTVGQALILAVIFGLLFTILLSVFAGQAIKLLRGRPDVIKLGVKFLRAVAFSVIPYFIVTAGNACLRGSGNTRTPMIVMGVVTTCNVILGYFLIYGGLGFPSLGVLGAGIAATISRTIGCAAILVLLIRGSGVLRFRLSNLWPFDMTIVRRIFRIGLPAGIEQIQLQLAMTVYTIILPLAYLLALALHLGPVGAWSAAVFDVNMRGAFLWWRFSRGGWKKIIL